MLGESERGKVGHRMCVCERKGGGGFGAARRLPQPVHPNTSLCILCIPVSVLEPPPDTHPTHTSRNKHTPSTRRPPPLPPSHRGVQETSQQVQRAAVATTNYLLTPFTASRRKPAAPSTPGSGLKSALRTPLLFPNVETDMPSPMDLSTSGVKPLHLRTPPPEPWSVTPKRQVRARAHTHTIFVNVSNMCVDGDGECSACLCVRVCTCLRTRPPEPWDVTPKRQVCVCVGVATRARLSVPV